VCQHLQLFGDRHSMPKALKHKYIYHIVGFLRCLANFFLLRRSKELTENRDDIQTAVAAYNKYMAAHHMVISSETLETAKKIETKMDKSLGKLDEFQRTAKLGLESNLRMESNDRSISPRSIGLIGSLTAVQL
jgi:hypothetical protein